MTAVAKRGGSSVAIDTLSRNIRREREAQHLTLRQLAARSGVNATTVLRAEQGHDVRLSIAEALASALGFPLTAMLTGRRCARCSGQPASGFICSACGCVGGQMDLFGGAA